MEGKKISTSMALSPDVIEAATNYAAKIDRSLSWYVNDLLKQDLKANKFLKR